MPRLGNGLSGNFRAADWDAEEPRLGGYVRHGRFELQRHGDHRANRLGDRGIAEAAQAYLLWPSSAPSVPRWFKSSGTDLVASAHARLDHPGFSRIVSLDGRIGRAPPLPAYESSPLRLVSTIALPSDPPIATIA